MSRISGYIISLTRAQAAICRHSFAGPHSNSDRSAEKRGRERSGLTVSRKALAAGLAGTVGFTGLAYAQLGPEDDNRVLFEANTVTRASENSPIVAEGDVKAYFGDQYLSSEKVIYDPQTDIVTAVGNVSITDSEGQTFFADDVELTGDFADGIATNFSALLASDARLAGATVIKNGDNTNELNNGVFTACKVCKENGDPKRPSWQVKALKVTQDRDEQVIRFDDAVFEVLGVPVFYSPYLQIPDPSVERQSGLLTPSIGNSSILGTNVEIPYYFVISEHQDFTFAPKITEKQGILYKGEYRIRSRNGGAIVQAGVIDTDGTEDGERNGEPFTFDVPGIRYHVFSEGFLDFRDNWRASYDVNYVSDNRYLRSYDVLPEGELEEPAGVFRPDRLTSEVALTRRTDTSLFSIETLGFQSLRTSEDNALAAQGLPRVKYNASFKDMPLIGGTTTIDANFVSLMREEGLDTLRAVAAVQWERVMTTTGGHRFNFFGELRGDAFSYTDIDQGNEVCNGALSAANFAACQAAFPGSGLDDSQSTTRFLPTIGAGWSYPLARQTEQATIIVEPQAQLVISPEENYLDDIINEDSQFFEFDTTTLFDWNKSSGYDLWEDGQRLNFGLSAAAIFNNGISVEGSLGQQFRADETDVYTAFGIDAGLGDTTSDYVGSFEVRWPELFTFKNRFRFDKDDGTIRRAESDIAARRGKYSGNLNYVRVQTQAQDITRNRTEFLRAGAGYDLTDRWSVNALWRKDIAADRTTQLTYSLIYRDECTRVTFSYRNDLTRGDGFEVDRSITANVELLGLGN